MEIVINMAYLYSSISFVLGLMFMGNTKKAKLGNIFAVTGMLVAIIATSYLVINQDPKAGNIIMLILVLLTGTVVGKYMFKKVKMTAMSQQVSLFNALVGLSVFVISLNEVFINIDSEAGRFFNIIIILGIVFGGVSFTGSIIAYYKLLGKLNRGNSRIIKRAANMVLVTLFIFSIDILTQSNSPLIYGGIVIFISMLSLLYGVLLFLPVGGAEMSVLILLLTIITGGSTVIIGIIFHSFIMIVGGALVSSTSITLTIKMCKAMNRSLKDILFGDTKERLAQINDELKFF